MGVRGSEIRHSRNDGASGFGVAVTLSESPLNPLVVWVGMDDGNVQVSRDQGRTWREVSGRLPAALPGTYPSRVLASHRSESTAYLTLDAHRDGDFAPYVLRTDDFGESWTDVTGDLPTGSVNVIVEHPDNADLLFVGTEHAVFASFVGGSAWLRLPHFPTTAYDDLVVHPRDKDLVAGTHGRGIYILDDTQPLAELAGADESLALFTIPRGTLRNYWKDTSYRAQAEYAGENPPDGVFITYRLGAGDGEATLRITNARGQEVQQMRVPSAPGVHRVTWDLQWDFSGAMETWRPLDTSQVPRTLARRGATVSPGRYTVTLQARGRSTARTMEVRGDPDLPVSDGQYRTRERYLRALHTIQRLLDSESIPQERAASLREQLQFLDVTGEGFRGTSFMGPTVAQQEDLRALQEEFRDVLDPG